MPLSSLRFDTQDYLLLALINHIIDQDKKDRTPVAANLHPNGIIELAIPAELRMASAVLHLLDSLKEDKEEERLRALQVLRDEVLTSARTSFRNNTGRVLIQIMKELVRAHGDEQRQLRLAHDFRQAATGKPSVVRRMLRRYFLLEMPEAWNQAVFDHHVHDANTKGRKNATHLIMDAWIKGIRSLTVIYYNYVTPEAARELLSAAQIMGVTLRIGLLFHAPYRGRLVDFIWVPRGFSDAEGFLSFLSDPDVRDLMNEGHKATKWLETHVWRMLDHWNETDRLDLKKELGETPPRLCLDAFIKFVGSGQASLLHLAEFIHKAILPLLKKRADELNLALCQLAPESAEHQAAYAQLQRLDTMTAEAILECWNTPDHNPELSVFHSASTDPDCPEILRMPPLHLLDWITNLHSGNRIILNLANLSPEDVLNLLWDCQGLITHLELFNLKDWQEGKAVHTKAINDLQRAINEGSAPRLKQIIRSMIINCREGAAAERNVQMLGYEDAYDLETTEHGATLQADTDGHRDLPQISRLNAPASDDAYAGDDSVEPDIDISDTALEYEAIQNIENFDPAMSSHSSCAERITKLRLILRNIPILQDFYRTTKLYTRIGTDSTSRAGRRFGMGLVFPETLPPRARKELRETTNTSRLRLPLSTELLERITYRTGTQEDSVDKIYRWLQRIPGFRHAGVHRERDWVPVQEHTVVCNDGMCSTDTAHFSPDTGNIVTLGGVGHAGTNCFCSEILVVPDDPNRMLYINTSLANTLKVLAGFIPALVAFLLTQDNWVLAWFGAPLWFLITGFRNILQAVLGGGGLRRSPLLRWNSYVSWSRLCDSLMYTGFSVVLLELFLRQLVLTDMFDITSANNALMTFTIISLVNGCYIAGHNYFRGLQREAIIGNLFRSIFAIPVSLTYNTLFGVLLLHLGVENAAALMLSMAAIISKIASDTVAGVIEGIADRNSNVRLRARDYKHKLSQLFRSYGKLELLYPEKGVLDMLTHPRQLLRELESSSPKLRLELISSALDLMYFWFYQPRASYVFQHTVQQLSDAERLVLLRCQRVLTSEKEISQLFVDGLVGRKFAQALSFYLDRHEEYLRDMEASCLHRRGR